jgi:hypothetical protein
MLKLFQAVLPVSALAVDVLVQLLSFNAFRRVSVLRSVILGCAAGIIYLLAAEWELARLLDRPARETISYFIVDLGAFGCLTFCYFAYLGLVESARRTTIMRQVHAAGGFITEKELLRRCSAERLVVPRLERLARKGQAREVNGRYRLGAGRTVLTISKLITMAKLIVLGKRSEFDP